MTEQDTLVTLAIHSFLRAQALQRELEANGIESIIQHVGDSIVTRNVRVRIKASDIDRAIEISESMARPEEVEEAVKEETHQGELLVPIDFSDFTMHICEVAFNLANSYKTQVVLFHAFTDPTPHVNLIEEMLTRENGKRDKALQVCLNEVKGKQTSLEEQIRQKIAEGKLPNIRHSFQVKMGIPEEEILNYCRINHPQLIIMGSRTKAEIELEEIGSVTAEVLERSQVPVLALPKTSKFSDFKNLRNLAYATRFEDDDLMAFDKLMLLLKPFTFKVHFLHLAKKRKGSTEEDSTMWNEIKLRGISDYFKKNYPSQDITVSTENADDSLAAISQYVAKENIDIISLTTHRRSLFVRLFNPSTAKTMLDNSDVPLLVFHV